MTWKEFIVPKRKESEIVHYGCWWTLESHFPKYTVNWLKNTGELFAVSCGARDPNDEEVILIGMFKEQAEADGFMHGWRDVVGKPNSLSGLLARAKGHK